MEEIVDRHTKPKAGLSAIYGLRERGGPIRYIGKATNPYRRFRAHRDQGFARNPAKAAWLRMPGLIIEMVILEWTDDWETRERAQIAEARARGLDLFNLADGGDDPLLKARPAHPKRGRDPYQIVISRMVQLIAEGAKEGRDCVSLRHSVRQFRKSANRLKREVGHEGFMLWAKWLHDEMMPFEPPLLPVAQRLAANAQMEAYLSSASTRQSKTRAFLSENC